jgi:hypothetical protein
MRRQTDFAEGMMNSATSCAAGPVTINTFQQAAGRRHFLQRARSAMSIMQIA